MARIVLPWVNGPNILAVSVVWFSFDFVSIQVLQTPVPLLPVNNGHPQGVCIQVNFVGAIVTRV